MGAGPQLAVRETPGACRVKLVGSKFRYLPSMEPHGGRWAPHACSPPALPHILVVPHTMRGIDQPGRHEQVSLSHDAYRLAPRRFPLARSQHVGS